MNDIKPIKIPLHPEWLASGYYVYVAELIYKGKRYLYIGQTGDNNYTKARGPLYRISGHLTKGNSTQNQLIKHFRSKVLSKEMNEITEEAMERALLSAQIDYTFWKVADYTFDDGSEVYITNHTVKRKSAQAIEKYLIYHLQNLDGFEVFNMRVKNISKVNPGSIKLSGVEHQILKSIINE